MREDGFYWTAYGSDGEGVGIREWCGKYGDGGWWGCGSSCPYPEDQIIVLSAKLAQPSETEYLLSSPANAARLHDSLASLGHMTRGSCVCGNIWEGTKPPCPLSACGICLALIDPLPPPEAKPTADDIRAQINEGINRGMEEFYRRWPQAKPKSGMTDAERELCGGGQWVYGSCTWRDVQAALAAVEAEGK